MDVNNVGRIGGLLVILGSSLFVSSVESASFGDEEYQKTLEAIAAAQQEDKEPRELSDIYLWGAGKCRDAGGNATTIKLFESAISEDPMNARAHVLYADYLMGYRGLYEYAAPHYYTAIEIVEDNPTSYDNEFKQKLERSMQIMHRDGNDGIPIITSKKFSMFVTGEIKYGYPAPSVSDVIGGNNLIQTTIDGRRQDLLDGIAFTDGTIADNLDGISFFEMQVADNIDGISTFEMQLADNDEGIDFFEMQIANNDEGIDFFQQRLLNEIEERAEWIPMLETLLVENGGEVENRDEVLDRITNDVTGVVTEITINSAIAGHNTGISNSINQIQGAVEEKAGNLASVQRVKDEKAETEQKIKNAEEEQANNEAMIGEIKNDKANNEALQAERKAEIERNEKFRKQRAHELTKANRTFDWQFEILFRLGEPKLPNFKIKYREIEIEDGFFFSGADNFDHLFDTDSTLISGAVAKNFLISPELSLFLEAELGRRENRVRDPANNNRKVFEERSDEIAFKTEVRKKVGFNTALFKLSGSVADIENNDSNDDEAYRVTTSVRLSAFPPAEEIENDSRFRGQRSHHLEFGTGYVERDFTSDTTPTITESSYNPFVSWEELGILRGFMDVVTVYQPMVPDKSPDDGVSSTLHRFTVVPTMIPVYNLYKNDFWSGHELVTIGFPLSYAFGNTDFDRFSVGIRVEDRLVTRSLIAFRSTLSATFTHYPEIDHDEWAAFAQVKMNFGTQRKFRGANRVKR